MRCPRRSLNLITETVIKIGNVPLFSGFMYAAVGSYICQAFRRLDLRVDRFPWVPAVLLAVAAYANFFTHHYLPDVRWVLAVGFVANELVRPVDRRHWVHTGGDTPQEPETPQTPQEAAR